MKKILIFLLGLLAFGALGYACLYNKASDIQYDISKLVQNNLADKPFKNVTAKVDGRNILLTGNVTTAELKDEAETLSRVEGYHLITNDIKVEAAPASESAEYELSLTKSSAGDVVLSGDVPDSSMRHHLVAQLMEKFGVSHVQDKLNVNGSMPVTEVERITDLFMPLVLLDSGKIILNNSGISILGTVDSQEKNNQLTALAKTVQQNLLSTQQYSQQITVVTREEELSSASNVEEACQQTLDQLLTDAKVNFQSAKAVLNKNSYPLLDNVLAVTKKCSDSQLTITGHTDSTGSDITNKKISVQRAKAVADYFISKGLETNRLIYTGVGGNEPIADNNSPEGRALNRRITFKMAREK